MTILEDALAVKLNGRACWRCQHGVSWHTHPGKRFWSQGAVRQLTGDVVTWCGKNGCPCRSFQTEPLSSEELVEMTQRIRGGWRGKT